MLVVTTVEANFNGHQLQQPLVPKRLHEPQRQQQPPSPGASNVDDSRYKPLFALHRDLVNINSISGHEHAIAVYLETYLQGLNYTVERQNVDPLAQVTFSYREPAGSAEQQQQLPQRFNLLVHPPSHRRTPVLLTTHIDTVPPFYPYVQRSDADPHFDTHNPSTELWGRGTVDAKACIATQLFAAQSLVNDSLIPPDSVSHLFVVGEEIGGDGMAAVSKGLDITWDSVIFGEPTELKLAEGHKGILIFTLRAHGKAAHSGYPWLGASAVSTLVKALAALEAMPLPWSEKYGNSTLNIGTIQGGVAANVMAENATASIGIRIAAGSAEVVRKSVLDTVKGVDANIDVRFYGGAYGPVDIDHNVPGFETITVNYATDIPILQGRHKRYLYGPGSILVAHSDHEHLAARDMVEAVEGYERIILHAVEDSKHVRSGR